MARTGQIGREISLEGSDPRNILDIEYIENDLCKLLDGVERWGSFVSSGTYNEAPLPDLCLKDFGPIPLPLAKRDADALTRECTEGDEDNAPRIEEYSIPSSGFQKYLPNQWEVEPQSFDIRNPAWSKFVEMVAIKVSKDMGLKPDAEPLEARMTSVRLWASGACLPPLPDPPSMPDCFGKLLICLPAAHRGGSLRLKHIGEKTKVFTENSSDWSYSYVAWHRDVFIEFTPLISGYRLMIEYDLSAPSPVDRKLSSLYLDKAIVRGALKRWNRHAGKESALREFEIPTSLAYVCDSYYEVKNLGFNVLEGKDRLRGACLRDICSKIGIDLYIANLDRTRFGYSVYPHYDDPSSFEIDVLLDTEITLTKIVDLYGNIVESDASLDDYRNLIQSDLFKDDPYSESFDPINQVVTQGHRKTVFILVSSSGKGEWHLEKDQESRPNKRKRGVEIIDLE
ncbi:hypothetical protein BDR22DRAFT_933360 [Usnea florida]